ncbi:unnamed protein product, partial [Closterium sp. NIES-54]
DSVGVGAGGAATGGTRSRGSRSGGAGAGGAGAGGASSGGTGAGGTGAGGASSGGAGAGGGGAVGASTEETGAGGTTTAVPTAPPHRHDTCLQALRRFEREEQERLEQEGQELQQLDQQQQHCCPLRAWPSSPLADLRTVLFCSSPRRSLRVSVLPSPPELSLTDSSHPITDYYCAARPVVSVFSQLLSPTLVPHHCLSRLLLPQSLTLLPPAILTPPRVWWLLHLPILCPSRFLAAASPSLCAMLLSLEGDPDALDIPTPRTYREAMSGEWDSQWKAAMDSELASWTSTCTYVDVVPPPRANVVDGMWLFKVKRPPGSPPMFKACYVARGFSHAFLQGRLHEEIWLRRPPGFTDTFPPGTQWSLRRPVYGLRQSPHEWHDTLRSTLHDLGFRPSSAESSLFVRVGSTPFFILVYVNNLVFATADRAALAEVKSKLQKRHTCTDLGELQRYLGLQITRDRAARTITLTQSHMEQQVLWRFGFQFSTTQPTPLAVDHRLTGPFLDEPFESSGPYTELVGCLMYLMTCTWPSLALPLSVISCFVATGRHRPIHWKAAVRVAKYLATTSGMGLVLGGTQPVELTGHCDSSYADDVENQHSTQGYCFSLGAGAMSWRSTGSSSMASSSSEEEIYAGAMVA